MVSPSDVGSKLYSKFYLRKKPFVGFNEPELTPEELEAMKKGSGLVPLSRITEHLASLPDYVPTDRWAVIGCQL